MAGVQHDHEQVVVLSVAASDYAVPIGRVQEIVRVPEITSMPNAADGVLGLINLRGRVVPVVDLAERLRRGRVEPGRLARIVVVDRAEDCVGLLVDGVSEVLRLTAADMEPLSDSARGASRCSVRGVAKVGQRLVLMLDLDPVLDA